MLVLLQRYVMDIQAETFRLSEMRRQKHSTSLIAVHSWDASSQLVVSLARWGHNKRKTTCDNN